MRVVPRDLEVDRVEVEAVRWVAARAGLAALACGEGEDHRIANLEGCGAWPDLVDVAGSWGFLINRSGLSGLFMLGGRRTFMAHDPGVVDSEAEFGTAEMEICLADARGYDLD